MSATTTAERNLELVQAACAFAAMGVPVRPGYWIEPDGRCSCWRSRKDGKMFDTCDADPTQRGKHPLCELRDGKLTPIPHTLDTVRIHELWRQFPIANVRAKTGEQARLAGIDADQHGEDGDASLRKLEAEHPESDLRSTANEITGRGRHYLYRPPTGFRLRAERVEIAPGLEFFFGADLTITPSVTVDGARQWDDGGDPTNGATIATLPDWLAKLATEKAERTAERDPAGRAKPLPETWPKGHRREPMLSLAGTLRACGLDDEDLILVGLEAANATRCTETCPERSLRGIARDYASYDGPTLTLDPAKLESLRPLAERLRGRGLTPEEIYPILEAVTAKRANPPYRDEDVRQIAEGSPKGAGQTWPDPIPLSSVESLPEFPMNRLTPWLARFVKELATETQTPLGLCGPICLATVAAAVQRRVAVQVRRGWGESTSLYMVSALDSGGRKSAVFTRATLPLEERERELAVGMRDVIATAKNEVKILERRLARAQDEASKAEAPDCVRLAVAADLLAKEVAAKEVPTVLRLIVADVTPERVGSLLAANGGRLAAFSDEGTLFKVLGGLYSEKGVASLDPLLKAHAGTNAIRCDRQGREPVFVERPALTIGMLLQPKIIADMAANPAFRGEGLLARIAFSMPRTTVGERDADAPPMDDAVARAYDEGVKALLLLPEAQDARGAPASHALHVGRAGLDRLLGFMRRIEPRRGPHGDLAFMADWVCKADGLIARLAALLHLCDHAGDAEPWTTPVTADAMDRAIALVESYFLPHARAVFDLMGANPETALAGRAVGVIVRRGWREPFTRKQMCDALHVKAGDWGKALAPLIENAIVRDMGKAETGGRPGGPWYAANPGIFDAPWAQELAR